MSSAFVKEGDDMWLHDIAPTNGCTCKIISHGRMVGYVSQKRKVFLIQKNKHRSIK